MMMYVQLVWIISILSVEGLFINQHTCEVSDEDTKLVCPYSGEGDYTVDRRLGTIRSIEFPFFSNGRIYADDKNVPALKTINVKETTRDVVSVCTNIFVDRSVSIMVEGNNCERINVEVSTSSTTHGLTLTEMISTTIELKIQTEERKFHQPTNSIFRTVMIILAVLLGIIILLLPGIIYVIRKRLRTQPISTQFEIELYLSGYFNVIHSIQDCEEKMPEPE